jgi:regulator of sirC expression with transglutaminase-like and TPR domain
MAALWASSALGAAASRDADLAQVRTLLALPEDKVDLTRAKLTIDKMIDPGVDIRATVAELDAMAAQVRATLSPGANSRERVEALRSFVYEPGPGKRPFAYDQRDPTGRNIQNKLLTTYLATRRGNCISMPILFILVGQRLGIEVTAATAPEHVFVKYRDESGTWFNLETTSGAGFTSDGWIQKNMPMTPQALANGLYMRPLSRRETVAVMLGALMEWYREQGEAAAVLTVAHLLLERDPKDALAMLHISSAYHLMYRQEFISKYARRSDVPTPLIARYRELEANMQVWRARAEALGWREPERSDRGD